MFDRMRPDLAELGGADDGTVIAAITGWAQIEAAATLIKDPEALALADKALAGDALRYGPLSSTKTAAAIDAVIDRYDPGALRHTRTIAQRRADALGALAAGGDRLGCGCGNRDCPAAAATDAPSGAVIHVLADAKSLDVAVDPHHNGEQPPSRPITPDMTLQEALTPEPEPDPPAVKTPPALILGGPLIPAPLLAELIATGAMIRPLRLPGPDSAPEPGYRPSRALEEFVRCRDMTCRFPECDRPAEFCDIDHAIAYANGGSTHPSKLRCCEATPS